MWFFCVVLFCFLIAFVTNYKFVTEPTIVFCIRSIGEPGIKAQFLVKWGIKRKLLTWHLLEREKGVEIRFRN